MVSRLILLSSVLVVLCCAVAESSFSDSNPIRMVSDIESEVVRVIGQTPHTHQFAQFAHKYGRRYATEEEMKLRYRNFVDTLKMIKSTNEKRLSYKLGVNEFSDWTWEEFKEKRLLKAPQNCAATSTTSLKLNLGATPASKDWREEGIIGPIKNQGNCGSCWTFSTTGALEAAYTQAHQKKENISLSEQQLLDCAGDFDNHGCDGGLPSYAFEYVKYNGGLLKDADYPYTAVQGKCQYQYQPGCDCGFRTPVKVQEVVNITSGDESAMTDAVGKIRPASVAFMVLDDFRSYKSGVYHNETCGNTTMDVNHAVLAVGYGYDEEAALPYWILKNSWGADWGDHGYFKLLKGVNMCGIAVCSSYPTIRI